MEETGARSGLDSVFTIRHYVGGRYRGGQLAVSGIWQEPTAQALLPVPSPPSPFPAPVDLRQAQHSVSQCPEVCLQGPWEARGPSWLGLLTAEWALHTCTFQGFSLHTA